MLACTKDSKAVVDALLHLGASLKLRNKDGWTPFHIACRYVCMCSTPIENFVSFRNRTALLPGSGTGYPVLEPAAQFENWTTTFDYGIYIYG